MCPQKGFDVLGGTPTILNSVSQPHNREDGAQEHCKGSYTVKCSGPAATLVTSVDTSLTRAGHLAASRHTSSVQSIPCLEREPESSKQQNSTLAIEYWMHSEWQKEEKEPAVISQGEKKLDS